MKVVVLFLVLWLSGFSVLAEAAVGISRHTFSDHHRARSLDSYILYPRKDAGDMQLYAQNIAFKGFRATQGRIEAKGKKLPVYIFAHGTSGNWRNLSWLAYKLAKDGAIVLLASYPGYSSGQASAQSVIRMWDQPKDVSFMLDRLLLSEYQHRIDKQRIAVLGYSLGGYSALALSGAVLDLPRWPAFCAQRQDRACNYFTSAFAGLTEQDYLQAGQSHYDPRIKASISIAPGFVPAMTQASMASVRTPSLILSAESDQTIPFNDHIAPYQPAFSPAIQLEHIKQAGHFSFMQICLPGAKQILAAENAAFVCDDAVPGVRSQIHQQAYMKIKRFLEQHLGRG